MSDSSPETSTPDTVTRVQAVAYGGPEALSVVAEPLPEPGPGEVRVDLRACGVNPADLKSYADRPGRDPAALPVRLGFEGAGVVAALGPHVAGVALGDEVIVYPASGAYASSIVVPVDALTPKPASLGWAEAAGLLLTGATAVHALTATDVHDGDTVLVHGGAGGVGLMAVQLARLRGATVIATGSEQSHDRLRELGATPVKYGDGLLERVREAAPQGVDAALDLVGTDEAMDVSLAVVADRQRIASIANFVRGPEEGVRLLGGGPGADAGDDVRDAARGELARLAGEGSLRVLVGATYPLTEAAQAHARMATRHSGGKLVLIP